MTVSMVDRKEDMSPDGFMRLTVEEDGDIIVTVYSVPTGRIVPAASRSVQFCTGQGGGGSPRTLSALRKLFKAMSEDNADPLCDRRKNEFPGDASRFPPSKWPERIFTFSLYTMASVIFITERLQQRSQWYAFEPMPAGVYEISVKEELKPMVEGICNELKDKYQDRLDRKDRPDGDTGNTVNNP